MPTPVHVEGLGEFSGAVGEIPEAAPRRDVFSRRTVPSARHQRDTLARFKGANQHRSRAPSPFGHDVEKIVVPVAEIHVGPSRRAEHGPITPGKSARRVASGIALGQIGLHFHDASRRAALGRLVHQDTTEQPTRHLDGAAFKKSDREGLFSQRVIRGQNEVTFHSRSAFKADR